MLSRWIHPVARRSVAILSIVVFATHAHAEVVLSPGDTASFDFDFSRDPVAREANRADDPFIGGIYAVESALADADKMDVALMLPDPEGPEGAMQSVIGTLRGPKDGSVFTFSDLLETPVGGLDLAGMLVLTAHDDNLGDIVLESFRLSMDTAGRRVTSQVDVLDPTDVGPVAPVPLPAGAALLVGALGVLAATRRAVRA